MILVHPECTCRLRSNATLPSTIRKETTLHQGMICNRSMHASIDDIRQIHACMHAYNKGTTIFTLHYIQTGLFERGIRKKPSNLRYCGFVAYAGMALQVRSRSDNFTVYHKLDSSTPSLTQLVGDAINPRVQIKLVSTRDPGAQTRFSSSNIAYNLKACLVVRRNG